jgi:tetratricopeptide (TPR) repeat protein
MLWKASVLALGVFSASAAAAPRWLKVTSPHFEMYTTASESKARAAVLHFEQVRGFFLKASGWKPASRARVRIVAFQSLKEYKPYQLHEGTAAHAGGWRDRDEIVMGGVSEESYPVAVHEYVHILLRPAKKIPLWINEGLAELYSSLRPVGKKVRVGDLLPGRFNELRWSKGIDLETLTKVDSNSPEYTDRNKSLVFYAESWALTHMLFMSDEYRPGFPDFFHRVVTGEDQGEAFQRAFGKSMAQVWRDLQSYIHGWTFKVGIFDVQLEKSSEEPEVRPASALESGVVLAGLLASVGKKAEARAAYSQLERAYPASPEVCEELGYLAWGSNSVAEAREQFAKAAKLGSKSARLYYDYASLVGDSGAGEPRKSVLLRKAVELDPECTEARFRLAQVLIAEQDYRGALIEMSEFKQVEPDRAFQFFYGAAYANYMVGNRPAAVTAAKRALPYAATSQDKAAVEDLITKAQRPVGKGPAARGKPAPSEKPLAEEQKSATMPTLSRVEGVLVQLDCLKAGPRLRIRSGGRIVRLLIDNPQKIWIKGTGSTTFTFDCGPQKPRRVAIEYEPKVEVKLGTVGLIRVLEFK